MWKLWKICVSSRRGRSAEHWFFGRFQARFEKSRTRTHCCSVQTLPDTTRTTLTVDRPPSVDSATICRPQHVLPRGGLEPRLTRGSRAGRGMASLEEGWPFSIRDIARATVWKLLSESLSERVLVCSRKSTGRRRNGEKCVQGRRGKRDAGLQ